MRVTHLEVTFLKINKTGLLHSRSLHSIFNDRERTADLLTTLDEEFPPLVHSALLSDTSVIAVHSGKSLVAFYIATRLETPIRFFEELVPVYDTADKPTEVDVILRVRGERPLLGAVFDIASEVSDMSAVIVRSLTISSWEGSSPVELAIYRRLLLACLESYPRNRCRIQLTEIP